MIALRLLGDSYWYSTISWAGLFIFSIGAIICCTILSWFYNKINHKTNNVSIEIEKPIYDFKDLLLQDKIGHSNYLTLENSSIWVKAVVYVLIFLVAITPFSELLGIQSIY